MKKFVKILLIIIFILVILFAVHTIRNFIIIKELQENIKPYLSKTNFMTKFVTQYENNMVVTTYYYEKNGKQRLDMERNQNGEIIKMDMYNNDGTISAFTENGNEKTYTRDNPSMMSITLINIFETDNDWQTFIMGAMAIIRKVDYNGKEAYKVTNFVSPYTLASENGETTYIDKDTGLIVKFIQNNSVVEREYEFDNVSDEVFIEPDISEYKLVENN